MPEALREDHLRRPHPARLPPLQPGYARIIAAHDAALASGQSDYEDPATRARVMTAAALVARGTCCHLGCRHCPFVGADLQRSIPLGDDQAD